MIFLPIVDRELRVAARRPNTYRIRFWTVLAALGVGVWKILAWLQGPVTPSAQGQELFFTLSVLAFIYSLFIGALVTADCLSAEKREGTLGLLFLTDLKGYDVILGKLISSSIHSIYGLVAILPLLAMPLLLGGVTAGDFWRMALVLLNTLFFSLAVGVLVSTLSRHERKAMMGTLLTLFLAVVWPLLLVALLSEMAWFSRRGEYGVYLVLVLNPVFPFACLSSPFKLMLIPPELFWVSVGLVHLLGWASLLWASALLPRVWEEGQPGARRQRWRTWWQQWAYGDAVRRQAFRVQLLEVNPFLWLAGRDRLKSHYAWGFLLAMLVIWWGGYLWHGDVMFDRFMLNAMLFLCHTFFKIWVISEACSRLVEEQQIGSMELLLATPLTVQDIVRGQLLALRRQFTNPMLALLVFDVVLLLGIQGNVASDTSYAQRDLWLLFAAIMGMFVADVYTLSWVGMWEGLVARNTNRAIATTMTRVLVLPWVLFLGGGFFEFSSRGEPNVPRMIFWWVTLGLLNDIFCSLWARRNLRTQFRQLATERLRTRTSWRAWLGMASTARPPVFGGDDKRALNYSNKRG